ncbi:hypothetical protein M569_06751, partial [Genlisea aurea]
AEVKDLQLATTRARFSNIFKRHEALTERLSRDSDKTVFERLQREFDAARASQTREVCLDGEEWNDGPFATIRERVHLEAERKEMQLQGDSAAISSLPPLHEKITYRVGNKLICCLEGARIGILYEASFAGEPCEVFHCVLESKSFLEKMTVVEHTIPFGLPIRDAENDYLSTNVMKFIDHIGDLLQAYVDRKEQIRILKELYGNQISELYFSLQYNMVEFSFVELDCKVVVSLRYNDLICTLPSEVRVLAWPVVHQYKKHRTVPPGGGNKVPAQLAHAETAFRSMSLPEAFAEVVLNMPQIIQESFCEE